MVLTYTWPINSSRLRFIYSPFLEDAFLYKYLSVDLFLEIGA